MQEKKLVIDTHINNQSEGMMQKIEAREKKLFPNYQSRAFMKV